MADAEGVDASEGDPRVDADPLLAWALASFHVVALVVGGVLLLHLVGALGSLLQGVGTALGLGLYLALWTATWRTNARWLREADLTGVRTTVVPGAKWGAVTGVAFFAVVLVVVAVAVGQPVLAAVLLLAGTLVSPVVGAAVGAGFAALDYLLVRAARRLARAERF